MEDKQTNIPGKTGNKSNTFIGKVRTFINKHFKKEKKQDIYSIISHFINAHNQNLEAFRQMIWYLNKYKEPELCYSGLKVCLYFPIDPDDEWQHVEKLTHFCSNLPAVDFSRVNHSTIIEQLKNSKFISYASIIVLLHKSLHFENIAKAMQENPYLRYKSKVILCRYNLSINVEFKPCPPTNSEKAEEKQIQESFVRHDGSKGVQKVTHSRRQKLEKRRDIATGLEYLFNNIGTFMKGNRSTAIMVHGQYTSIDDWGESQRNYDFFKNLAVDNFILAQWYEHDDICDHSLYVILVYRILADTTEVLEIAIQNNTIAITSTSTEAHYVFNINPALAIIINNNFFTEPHTIRNGSEKDVISLIRELKIARTPYILMEDCSENELLDIVHYIESKDFYPLKSLLLFFMSHGGEHDILFTRDGKVDIKKIIECIQNNKSLQNNKLQFVFNKCRGGIPLQDADEDDLEQIQASDSSHLKDNTIVMYSVPDKFLSPRSDEKGCPFVQSFCKNFRLVKHIDDIRKLYEKINEDLSKHCYYYEGLDTCSELMLGKANQLHNIIQRPENFFQMMHLLKSIVNDFPIRETSSNFEFATDAIGSSSYVYGVLNSEKFPKEYVQRYFAKELEDDTFSVCNDSDDE